jgi:hypothetical protein
MHRIYALFIRYSKRSHRQKDELSYHPVFINPFEPDIDYSRAQPCAHLALKLMLESEMIEWLR